jgi:F-type H+-transporting ATPase subunit b
MDAIIELINIKHIPIQLFIFLCVVFFLNRLVFKPVLNLLAEREKRIFGDREEAKKLVKQVEERVRKYEEKMYKAKTEAKDLKGEIIHEALKNEREILSEAREDSSKIIAKMRENMVAESRDLKPKLNKEAEVIAREMAETVLGRKF